MKKLMIVALMAGGIAAGANAVDLGLAVSGTVNAGAEKVGQAVESVKGSYHEEMAKQDYDAAKKDLNSGDLTGAIDNASSSLVHEAEAKKADGKAAKHKKEASKAMHRAKVGVGAEVSGSASVK
jgi:hypothetical protein